MTRLLQLVADYGDGDLAYAELVQRVLLVAPDTEVVLTHVSPHDTLAAGYRVAHLALTPGPEGRIVCTTSVMPRPGGRRRPALLLRSHARRASR